LSLNHVPLLTFIRSSGVGVPPAALFSPVRHAHPEVQPAPVRREADLSLHPDTDLGDPGRPGTGPCSAL